MFTFSLDRPIIQGYMFIYVLATSNNSLPSIQQNDLFESSCIQNYIQAFRQRKRVVSKDRCKIIYGRIGLLISQLLLFISACFDIYCISYEK